MQHPAPSVTTHKRVAIPPRCKNQRHSAISNHTETRISLRRHDKHLNPLIPCQIEIAGGLGGLLHAVAGHTGAVQIPVTRQEEHEGSMEHSSKLRLALPSFSLSSSSSALHMSLSPLPIFALASSPPPKPRRPLLVPGIFTKL
jgi:hypothetical protein